MVERPASGRDERYAGSLRFFTTSLSEQCEAMRNAILLATVVTGLTLFPVQGAPAPATKPIRLQGAYVLTWGTKDYQATFHADGRYECYRETDGAYYTGRWSLMNGVLTVTDRLGSSSVELKWSVRLRAGLKGTAEGDYGTPQISLTPAPGR
jgi:hypothetical protein